MSSRSHVLQRDGVATRTRRSERVIGCGRGSSTHVVERAASDLCGLSDVRALRCITLLVYSYRRRWLRRLSGHLLRVCDAVRRKVV